MDDILILTRSGQGVIPRIPGLFNASTPSQILDLAISRESCRLLVGEWLDESSLTIEIVAESQSMCVW